MRCVSVVAHCAIIHPYDTRASLPHWRHRLIGLEQAGGHMTAADRAQPASRVTPHCISCTNAWHGSPLTLNGVTALHPDSFTCWVLIALHWLVVAIKDAGLSALA